MVRKTLYFIMPAHARNLSVVDAPLARLFDELTEMDVSEAAIYDVKLAVQELCTNIVNHAYEGEPGKIRLRITVYDEPPCVVITSQDEGLSTFNPTEWTPPTLDEPQVHGLGLYLIHQLMDEVTYQPSPGNNCWRLIKALGEASESADSTAPPTQAVTDAQESTDAVNT